MKIKIVTLFPSMYTGFLEESIIKRTIEKELVSVSIVNLRDYSNNKHHKVDDTPYGGGAGMVLNVPTIDNCLNAIRSKNSKTILMSPMGKTYKQKDAYRLANEDEIILICGHYEGFDERVRDLVDEELSIGEFVMTGGEIASMAIADSVIRLIEGAIATESHETDSYSHGLLGFPQYTRPVNYKGSSVPFVLQNGNHKLIKEYRLKEQLRRTYLRRPDMLINYKLSKEEEKLLQEVKEEELKLNKTK